jgi:hypothetical protein
MKGVLSESPIHPSFKFEQSFRLTHFMSLSFSGLAFVLILAFTVSNLGNSTDTIFYNGLVTQESPGKSFLQAVLPVPQSARISYGVFVELFSSDPDSFYDLDVEIFCQWFDSPARRIHQIFRNITMGRIRLFSTSLFTYKSLLIQIQITNLLGRDPDRIRLVAVQTTSEFGGKSTRTRFVLSAMSLILAAAYLSVLLILARASVRIEQILTAVCLGVSIVANFPLKSFVEFVPFVIFDGIICAIFSACNLVALLCFLQKSNPRNLRFVLVISALFLLAESMYVITSDTNLLSRLFEDNRVIWIFFLSTTVISSVGYAVLLIRNLMMGLCRSRLTRKTLFLAYGLAAFIALLPLVGEAVLFFVTGAGNFAIDFCSHYLAQTLLVFLYADMHWPLPTSELGEALVSGHEFQLRDELEV